MSLDRPIRRKNAAKPDHTPHTDAVVAPPAQTATPSQQVSPEPATSSHNFSDIALMAPETQPAAEEAEVEANDTEANDTEANDAIDAEQSHEIIAKRGRGAPLASTIREPMEAAFGHNFAQVRIHADAEANTLNRQLDARAFTLGNDIFLSQAAASAGLHARSPLLAHELTHVVQQEGAPVAALAPGEALAVSDPQGASEYDAERTAEAVAAGDALADQSLATTAPHASVARTIQRAPAKDGAQTAAPAQQSGVSRNDVELLGARLKMRQIDLAVFLNAAKTDIDNIRAYFKWVNDVYSRCYEHYDLVMKQAKEQADTQQAWIDLVSGVATGVAVGLFAEAIIPLEAASKALEYAAEVGAEVVEGGIAKLTKTDAPALAPPLDLNPAFKQLVALQQLDKLNAVALSMAVPGAYIYSDPIVESERLSAELRVAEAGGQRRMSDADVQESYLKLMRFEAASLLLDARLREVEPRFDALRKAYMGKQAPTDQRCEQDIWIPWIAKQNPGEEGFWSLGPVLNREIFRNHFVDIGLAARGTRGGRLNADVDTYNADAQYDPEAHTIVTVSASEELVLGAKAALRELPAYWSDVFLMGGGGGAKGS